MNNADKPVMIAGVGNLIQMDDGVGIHTIRELQKMELPDNIELFDGGTLGVDLMPYIEGKEKLIVIDSVDAGEKPGTLFRFKPDDLNYEKAPKTSVHQIGLIESLQMVKLVGKAPDEVIIFGVQPGLIDWGEELTDEVKAAVPKLIKHIVKEIENSEIKNPKLEE